MGYRGGYSAVTDCTRAWRELSGKSITKAFVPLSFELGTPSSLTGAMKAW
jgi:hypothetical protein